MNEINVNNRVKKALVKIISFGYSSKTVRASLYRFCSHYYDGRFMEENLEIKYIPQFLRKPNSEFMMVWDGKSGKLIRIEKLEDKKLQSIKKIIEKYELSLNYFDIQEEQEIENEYLDVTREFFNQILEVNYGCGLISDRSCLDYYAVALYKSIESYQEKIKLYYDLEIDNISDCPILDIIKQINNR